MTKAILEEVPLAGNAYDLRAKAIVNEQLMQR